MHVEISCKPGWQGLSRSTAGPIFGLPGSEEAAIQVSGGQQLLVYSRKADSVSLAVQPGYTCHVCEWYDTSSCWPPETYIPRRAVAAAAAAVAGSSCCCGSAQVAPALVNSRTELHEPPKLLVWHGRVLATLLRASSCRTGSIGSTGSFPHPTSTRHPCLPGWCQHNGCCYCSRCSYSSSVSGASKGLRRRDPKRSLGI